MPASIKLQEEYGDKVQVVFVSVGSDSPDKVQAFALKKKWLGGRSMWTCEPPFETGIKTIPATVLVSSSGEVLFADNPNESKLKDLIEEDLKAKEKGPKDAPDAVRKAWADFGKGYWGKARVAAQAVIDKPPPKDGDAAVAAAKAALESFGKGIDARFARVDRCVADGLFDRAADELAAIGKAVKGDADLVQRHADALAKLNGDDLKAERDAAAALAKLEKKLYANGPEDNSAKQLEAFAEKYSGTRAGDRARYLATLVQG
ncbi:MAG TPA: hypothetical protein VFD43_09315 [Planctomycetota bacterium]|nr:hypothetical protein [Planctomycetota bacterium]